MLTILNVVGARPNLMKIAPLIHAMQAHGGIRPLLVHTGQHYDEYLSGVFFRELKIPAPDFHLGAGSMPRLEQIARIQSLFEPVLQKIQPDVVLVVGDVNSTVACARVARAHRIPIAHVEAGLRSFDRDMPEEHNRIETDELCDFLFVTEESGMRNLDRENVPGRRLLVGNVMIDTLVQRIRDGLGSDRVARMIPAGGKYVVLTLHRPSNVDSPQALRRMLDIIQGIAARIHVVFPVHPRTGAMLRREALLQRLESTPNISLTEPLGYTDFVSLIAKAAAVVTDSGGVQEETTYLGVPCITMRDNTERPCTVSRGTNVLVGSDAGKLMHELEKAIAGPARQSSLPELWDGRAAGRIVAHLWEHFRHNGARVAHEHA